jgi:hypothetical protein
MAMLQQILEAAEGLVKDLLKRVDKRDDDQDTAIKDLQDRVDALEKGTSTTTAKKTAAARATTAGAKSSATGTSK